MPKRKFEYAHLFTLEGKVLRERLTLDVDLKHKILNQQDYREYHILFGKKHVFPNRRTLMMYDFPFALRGTSEKPWIRKSHSMFFESSKNRAEMLMHLFRKPWGIPYER